MDDMNQTSSPPCLDWDRIIHNSISYLKPICCVGLRSGCGASALITDTVRSGGGADTMHPVEYHGSTCLINSNRQLRWLEQ